MHYRSGGGDSFDKIRNQIDHRVVRPGGGGWDLTARCRPYYGGGIRTTEAIHLEHHDQQGKQCDAAFTTGEARVLARQLIGLADKIDLPG